MFWAEQISNFSAGFFPGLRKRREMIGEATLRIIRQPISSEYPAVPTGGDCYKKHCALGWESVDILPPGSSGSNAFTHEAWKDRGSSCWQQPFMIDGGSLAEELPSIAGLHNNSTRRNLVRAGVHQVALWFFSKPAFGYAVELLKWGGSETNGAIYNTPIVTCFPCIMPGMLHCVAPWHHKLHGPMDILSSSSCAA